MKFRLILAACTGRNSKLFALLMLAAGLLGGFGCNRRPAPTNDSASDFDRVSARAEIAPVEVVRGIEKLSKHIKYAFDVPAHVVTPRLVGQFSSFIQGKEGARIADEAADVELMVMTEEQYGAFEQKRSAESVYAIEPSHDQEVSISLPATRETPVRYYAVFRRAVDGKSPIWVEAELRAEFGAR